MCGRYAFYLPHEAMVRLFDLADDAPEVAPRYNIAPSNFVPVIRHDKQAERKLGMLHWGLVPHWAKDKKIGYRMINARSETVREKPSFRNAFRRRRCLVPVSGFYEWKKTGESKTPYFISMSDAEGFAFAGLWERWHENDDADPLDSVTICTTEANVHIAEIHQRMPVILKPGDYDAWLSRENSGDDVTYALLKPWPRDNLQAWPVSTAVNRPQNDRPDLIKADG
ncbi:MAG: SOS response-associated peptidase [Gammaproteobacteria bacterium]|nr:SOS response-associated peptidase [Gammaproteobacteria bacterium]